jgi:hypothetical protein
MACSDDDAVQETTSAASSSAQGTTGVGGGTGGDGGSSSSVGGGGSGSGTIEPALTAADFAFDCQPSVPLDPVAGTFSANYGNNDDVAGVADIASARLVLADGGDMLTWVFPVEPPDSGPVAPGEAPTVEHTKLADRGSGQGEGAPCDYCQGDADWTLQVVWETAGGNVMVELAVIVSCSE